jgi:hypothetical protein
VNWRIRVVTAVGALLIAAAPASPAEGPSASSITSGASVLSWNGRAAQLIVGPGGAAKVPPLGLVDLAIVHTAIYDAVNAIEGFPFRSYAVVPNVSRPASGDAAVAAAGRATLLALFPARSADIEAWYAASLATIADGPEKTNGVAAGAQAAAGILALRANDGRNAGTPIVEPPAATGVWVRTPPALAAPQAPWTRFITPWNMSRPSQFRPGPPPRLRSRTYRTDYEETRDFGGAVGGVATPAQQDIGRFWGDQPMLQWNRAWRGIAAGRNLSGVEAARYFAMLSTASSDALIACWDAKYEYFFWRPVTAIRAGGGDPRLTGDPAWLSLVATPPHPEYPAGHGCLTGAATSTLKRFFDTDAFTFTIDSAFAGVATPVRSYSSFSQALDEVVDARIYGGMHYRFSGEAGAAIGKKAAKLADRAFRPARHGDDDDDDDHCDGDDGDHDGCRHDHCRRD